MNTSLNTKGSWLANMIAVVFIFMVLLVLFPFHTHCPDRARKSSCTNNIKEIAIATLMYCNDYDGKLPSSALVNHSKRWNKNDFLKFGTMAGKLPPAPNAKRQTYVEMIYDHIKCKDSIFCPSGSERERDGPSRHVSYWWKLALDKAWYGDGCKLPYRKLPGIEGSSDQIMLYEHADFHDNPEIGLQNGARIAVVYMDSHVKRITIKNATSGDPINCAANSDGEPMYFNFNLKTNKRCSGPAKFVDPGVYGDSF